MSSTGWKKRQMAVSPAGWAATFQGDGDSAAPMCVLFTWKGVLLSSTDNMTTARTLLVVVSIGHGSVSASC
jgi:hypothetical protein